MAAYLKEAEEWRPVVGYEETYHVSSHGRVRRVAPHFHSSVGVGGMLSQSFAGIGYLVVNLSACGVTKKRYVHRLVLESFVGPRPELEANHRDGVKTNNHLDNLEWVTGAENKRHAAWTGLTASGDRSGAHKHPEKVPRGEAHWTRKHPERIPRGEARVQSKLTADGVREIRRLVVDGVKNAEIAARYGLHPAYISLIVRRKRWGHVE